METTTTRSGTIRILCALVMGLGIAAVMGIAAAPARADEDVWHRGHQDWREREWREHEWREREWRGYHPYAYVYPGYPGYAYSYAPPPVVYAPPPPPPVIYAPTPSVDFVFPVHIH